MIDAKLKKQVKEGYIKGVKSDCMICHIQDLGLTKDTFPIVKPSGLISFPKDVKIGVDVSKLLGLGDYIIEFEITPNRTDCLGVEGIAREFAATFDLECNKLWQDTKPEFEYVQSIDDITLKIDTKNCKKYVLNVVKDVKIDNSPFEMQLNLMKSGYSVINNIVDITNYVMLEMGSPLHAFDKDKIKDSVIVRQAYDKENITTLDKQERVLNTDNMVIADNEKPIAIAGVMGELYTGVNTDTTSVILESASFERGSIRNTSKKLLLRTDASAKYEKGLSPELTEYAMNRVCYLINTLGVGKTENTVISINNYEKVNNKISLDYEKINNIIGINLNKSQIDNILNKINIEVQDNIAVIPYYRGDIQITEDIAEEVARFYGYDKLPSSMPKTFSTFGIKTKEQLFEEKLKTLCLSYGYNEIYTYTFFSRDTLKKVYSDEKDVVYNLVKLDNPLSKDFEYMRTTTVPHMLEALERNNLRKNTNVKLFDLGKVFLNALNINNNKLCDEKLCLTLGMYGDNTDFYNLKSVISGILNEFKIEYDIKRSDAIYLHPGISADILVNGDVIASLGKVNPKIINNYTLQDNTYIAIMDIEKIFVSKKNTIKYKELPKYPAVERDIAFTLNEDILSSDIVKEIKNIDTIVEDAILFDVYQGNQIEKGMKSMAYTITLRSNDKTLEEKEITTFMNKLFDMLSNKFSANIRK